MRGIPASQGEGQRTGTARIALTGVGLSALLAIIVPLALLSRTAHGIGLPTAPRTVSTAAVQTQDEQGNVQGNGNVRSNVNSRQQLSRAQVVALVRRRYHARVVRTHLLQDAQGHPLYEFRLLSASGRVWTVRIDAYSGAELP